MPLMVDLGVAGMVSYKFVCFITIKMFEEKWIIPDAVPCESVPFKC